MKEYIPSQQVLKLNPTLTIDIGLPTETVLLFLTYVYHTKSELVGIQNTIERKFKAAELCDFPKKNKKYVNEDIILGINPIFNKMVIAYLKLFRSPIYAELKVYTDMLYTELENLNNAKEIEKDSVADRHKKAETRAKINSNIKLYAHRITELQAEFLVDDIGREILQDLYEDVLSDGLSQVPSPELVAYRVKDGKIPLGTFNPYEI